jgi:hypothetical protein
VLENEQLTQHATQMACQLCQRHKNKNKKIPCVFVVLWYSGSMKKKTPQKSQIWKVGTRCFRIVRIEGDQAVVRHHEEFGKFFLNDLRPASAEEVRAYFKK